MGFQKSTAFRLPFGCGWIALRLMEPIIRIKGLLIDMDGLLLDTERVAEKCWMTAEVETGFQMPPHFYHSMIGLSMRSCRLALESVMDPDCDLDDFVRIANREYHRALEADSVPVKPGAEAFLRYVSERGIPRCLATSTRGELCRHKLEVTGLLPYLPFRVCGDDVEHSKPAPDIYLKAAGKLGIACSDLLVLEDSENGMRAGLAAGCKVANVPDLGMVTVETQSQTIRVFRNLDSVLAAFERGEILVQS